MTKPQAAHQIRRRVPTVKPQSQLMTCAAAVAMETSISPTALVHFPSTAGLA